MKRDDMHRFSHEAMSTTFDAIIIHDDRKYASQAARAVFAEIDRFERLLSRHDPGTDLAQVNRLRPGQWMAVNLEVVECLEIAAQAYIQTGGAFDVAFQSRAGGARPSAMEFLLLSRPDSDEPATPSQFLAGIAPEAADANFDGAELDLGGIGKGYALDKCLVILDDWDIENALLNSGTSTVLARGPGPGGEGWPVGVSGDWHEMTGLRKTYLHNEALSGSGTAVKGDHIRNPKTGHAAPAIAAWTKSQTAAWTDAISTALMVMPREKAESLCREANLDAIVVYTPEDYLVTGTW